ncbi:glycosyl hydrolase [Fulvivirgaceae bacterium PWU5]|uniref:Glycosyl hydrolase n=1 Tax=Dawidia cretensis TaxID=2782350 RepID=A0AAP2E075_9BACT|nr:glycoside hydrolase family 2 TIM barrel-domain containing protein [Dawidia cretensis]MBT1709307.1 glycosyl hydrolase [Dawidia cretensis]
MKFPSVFFLLLLIFCAPVANAQRLYDLNKAWKARRASEVQEDGAALSRAAGSLTGWIPARVPGTVLTTLLENGLVPDPFYGMNNERIPDIYKTGNAHYTYWFVNDFTYPALVAGDQAWLHLRGVNYRCDVFLNGEKLNAKPHNGMFLRQVYNITKALRPGGTNRLAVIVHPADVAGNPNGGQGGDGTIAKNVAHQYVAGWDWIQPIRDRNTGIWDKVWIEQTKSINIKNPHVVTRVPGKRFPEGNQAPALINVSAELENPTAAKVKGTLTYTLDGQTVSQAVTIAPQQTLTVTLPVLTLSNPKLWWPNGYGAQHLYTSSLQFTEQGKGASDEEKITVGVREVRTAWNTHTRSREASVNGQKIFIKGGNWIISDAMLRFSDARYDAEIRFHRDMNLNLIRVWGGALIERPEFFAACDRYGLLVMQDFWMSGDCNGRWLDPMKTEDQWTRRNYPDDHKLFIASCEDQIKMVRNHPSLAMWCGGNEITPPADILSALRDDLLPRLDGTRWFAEYSNTDSMSYNSIGGNGDGPYGIQNIRTFWEDRTFPFNSEVGSVGVGDAVSLERFLPEANRVAPDDPNRRIDSVWQYHKYIGYDSSVYRYGKPKDMADFANKAQLVNYDQYRALMEGFSAHMWDWYTGTIIWKTQNPWTALRGQMYDYYLDPNACLYGLRKGSEPLHVMCNPVTGMVMVANNTFAAYNDLMLVVKAYDATGKERLITQVFVGIEPTDAKKYLSVKGYLNQPGQPKDVFLSLQLLDVKKNVVSENLYWMPDAKGSYPGLNQLAAAPVKTTVKRLGAGQVSVTLKNPAGSAVAFFNRVSLIDANTKKRLLPVFYSDNYVSVVPGEERTVVLDYTPGNVPVAVTVSGWNVSEQIIPVN